MDDSISAIWPSGDGTILVVGGVTVSVTNTVSEAKLAPPDPAENVTVPVYVPGASVAA